jgi:hypothetical protein
MNTQSKSSASPVPLIDSSKDLVKSATASKPGMSEKRTRYITAESGLQGEGATNRWQQMYILASHGPSSRTYC